MTDEPKNKSSAFARIGRFLFSTTQNYLVIVRGDSEGAGFKTLQQLFRGGPLNWLGLSVLTCCIIATAYLLLQRQMPPLVSANLWDEQHVQAPALATYISLAVISFAWAFLLVGAGSRGLGLYVLVATYVLWYGLLIFPVMGGTLWLAMVPLWLLVLGNRVAAAAPPSRSRLVYLALLSVVVAFFTYRSLGLGKLEQSILGSLLDDYRALGIGKLLQLTPGMFVLAVAYLAIVANPRSLGTRPFRPGIFLVISLILFLGYYALSLNRVTPDDAFSHALYDYYDLFGLLGLFWYWMGLDLFNGAHSLSDWAVATTKALLPERLQRAVVLALWALWLIVGYLLLRLPPRWIIDWLLSGRVGIVLIQAYRTIKISDVLASVLDYHLYITAGCLVLAAVLAGLRKLTHARLMGLLGVTLFSFFALLGYFGLFYALDASNSIEVLGFWPAVLYVGGIFWQMLMVSSEIVSESRARSLFFLGFLLAIGGISLLFFAASYEMFNVELALNTFSGAMFLGIPYMLYAHFYQRRRLTLVPTRQILLAFALGMASAIPCLVVESLLPAPILWLLALLVMAWRKGRWDEPQDGLVYALAMALGFVVFYTHRFWISMPSFSLLAKITEFQNNLALKLIFPWEPRWWLILAQSCAAAAVLGYLLSRARAAQGRRRALFLFLAPASSVALLAIGSVIMQLDIFTI